MHQPHGVLSQDLWIFLQGYGCPAGLLLRFFCWEVDAVSFFSAALEVALPPVLLSKPPAWVLLKRLQNLDLPEVEPVWSAPHIASRGFPHLGLFVLLSLSNLLV